LTTIVSVFYARFYDYQISCAHFCNRPCQHLRCASSVTDPDRIAITGKTPRAQKSGCHQCSLTGCRSCGFLFARRETHSQTKGNSRDFALAGGGEHGTCFGFASGKAQSQKSED
jgi:hypothetical protein